MLLTISLESQNEKKRLMVTYETVGYLAHLNLSNLVYVLLLHYTQFRRLC